MEYLSYETANDETFVPMTLMDKYPEYHLRPSSLLRRITMSPSLFKTVMKRIFLVIAIPSFITGVVIFCVNSGWNRILIPIVYGVFATGLVGMFVWLIAHSIVNRSNLGNETDYYQTNRRNKAFPYIFVIKDAKIGVWNCWKKSFSILPEYDYLKWRERKRLLIASKDGQSFVIDINGTRLP